MTRLSLPEPLKNLEYTRRKTGLWVPSPLRSMGLSRREYGARKCCCIETMPCNYCLNGVGPLEMLIKVPAGANVNCDVCNEYEGNYVTSWFGYFYYYCIPSDSNTSNCGWWRTFIPSPCDPWDPAAGFEAGAFTGYYTGGAKSGEYYTLAFLGIRPSNGVCFLKDYGRNGEGQPIWPDCSGFSDEEIPYWKIDTRGWPQMCDFVGTSILLTAL